MYQSAYDTVMGKEKHAQNGNLVEFERMMIKITLNRWEDYQSHTKKSSLGGCGVQVVSPERRGTVLLYNRWGRRRDEIIVEMLIEQEK